MKRKKAGAILALTCTFVLFLNFSACSDNAIADIENKLVDEEDAMKEPQFWNVADLINGNTNLYKINSESFIGKPYIDSHKFGDCILMIGSASYEENSDLLSLPIVDDLSGTDSDTDADSDTDFYDDSDAVYYDESYGDIDESYDYELSFEVYSPWRDSITYSIDHTETDADGYYAFDCGILVTYAGGDPFTFTVYDDQLEQIAQGSFPTDDNPGFLYNLYMLSDPNTFYSVTYDDNQFETYSIAEDGSISMSRKDSPLYNMSIVTSDQAGGYLVVSGVDPATYIDTIARYYPGSDRLESIAEYESYCSGSYYGENYIMDLNSYDSITQLTINGNPDQYLTKDYYSAIMLSDASVILPTSSYDETEDTTTYSAGLYSPDGECLSGYSFSDADVTSSSPYAVFLDTGTSVFLDQQLVFTLEYDGSSDPSLIAWDISNAGSGGEDLSFYTDVDAAEKQKITEDHENDPEYCDLITKVDDPDSYDWGQLTYVHERANELSEKYGIQIYIGPEVPDCIDAYHLGEMNDADLLLDSLNSLDRNLSIYPDNFLDQLFYSDIKGMRFYFTGTISGDQDGYLSEAAAYVTSEYGCKVMVIDCNYSWDLDYTLNHELSHMIDSRLDFVSQFTPDSDYSEDTWAAFNNDDFEYQYNYSNYEDYVLPDDVYIYILDPYASTYPTEDRAMIFGYACEAFLEDDYYMAYSFTDPIDQKLTYYSNCIREGFDTTGWPAKLPWEYILDY